MKVSIESNGEVIWYIDTDKREGMTSRGYIADGTQKQIISALEGALHQANGEMLCGDSVSGCQTS